MRLRSLVVLAVVLAACGGEAADSVPTTPSSAASTVPAAPGSAAAVTGESRTAVVTSSDETTTTRPAPNPDRELAPDFSLMLSDGTEYQLSNETRPVYMVFWAEW